MIYDTLHIACTALGTRLFTIMIQFPSAGVARRCYTSHPVEYPTSGTKLLTRDGWYDHVIAGKQTFVANTPPEFACYFNDHALITALGLGSCANLPVIHDAAVLGTVNLLAEAGHFTPAKLLAYRALFQTHHAALVEEMAEA